MIAPEDPPGFVVRTEAQKAAWDNGFRLERGVESGGWLRYGSTTARGEIWIAGVPPRGPWLLSIDHPASRRSLRPCRPRPCPGPASPPSASTPDRAPCRARPRLQARRQPPRRPARPVSRADRRPAADHRGRAARRPAHRPGHLPRRPDGLLGGRCPLTGITDPALLRASHIVPWAECDDAQRLDVHNGLLLSALWDAPSTRAWSASPMTEPYSPAPN